MAQIYGNLPRFSIKAFGTDMDGVQVNSEPMKWSAWNHGINGVLTKAEYESMAGNDWKGKDTYTLKPSEYNYETVVHPDFVQTYGYGPLLTYKAIETGLLDEGCTLDEAEEIVAGRYEEFYDAIQPDNIPLINRNVVFTQLLMTHKPDLRFGVGSADKMKNIRRNLVAMKMQDAFDTVVSGAEHPDVVNNKPEPDTYIVMCQELGVDPANVVLFEDTVAGCKAAKAAGIGLVIAVPNEQTKHQDFSEVAHVRVEPDAQLTDITDILQQVDPKFHDIQEFAKQLSEVYDLGDILPFFAGVNRNPGALGHSL